jgi:hypothetical protein
MTVLVAGDGLTFRPATLADKNYSVDALPGFVNVAESSELATVADANVRTTTADYSDPFFDLSIRGDSAGVVLSTLDPTGTLAGNRLSRVSNGVCRVLASHPLIRQTIELDLTRINDNVYTALEFYVAGSLARHIVDQLANLIGSKTSSAKPVYSLQNHTDGVYTRSPSCWAQGVDLTAVSPWNSRGGVMRAGVAISPRHTLHANHFPIAKDDTIRFVTAANAVITRTIANVASITAGGADTQIALLDADLPATITPAKLLPANLYDYLPSIESWPIPVLTFDAEENALTKSTDPDSWTSESIAVWLSNSADDPFSRMTEPIISGDSGNPIAFVIDGALAILGHWSTPTTGPLYHKLLTEIGAAMASLGGGYTPQTVGLSAFTNYGA